MSTTTLQKNTRIASLDVIRGFAILGILLMNIQSFSMVGQAYLNPMAYGDMTGFNKWVWIVSHVLADQKFLSIFSMLFGASVMMIIQNTEAKSGSTWRVHYSRNFWLLVIGVVHGYLMWYGDILLPYALCAFLVYFVRNLSYQKLLIWGTLVFSMASIIYVFIGLSIPYWPAETITEVSHNWMPTAKILDSETAAYLGSFSEQLNRRIGTANMMHEDGFLLFYFWRIAGLMMIGMSLFKSGFLQGSWLTESYRRIFLITGMIGLLLVSLGVYRNFQHSWSFEFSMFLGSQYNYWGSLLMSFAYLSGVILLLKSGKMSKLFVRFTYVGRMALTNYLMQTVICTFIFYGFGLGLFGQIDRIGQLLIVACIWVLQMWWSPIWLRYFKYGPLEWAWRSLTYMRLEKIRIGSQ